MSIDDYLKSQIDECVEKALDAKFSDEISGAKLQTIAEIAEDLKVSEKTVRNWIKKGLRPSINFGGIIRLSRRDVVEWQKSCVNRV